MSIKDINRYAYIDALRGWAILAVLVDHCGSHGTNNLPRWFGEVVIDGGYGVQLFYIVSALTLFLSLQTRRAYEKHPTIYFFIRRFFRIAPLFYVAVVYYLLVEGRGPLWWRPGVDEITTKNIIATVMFLNGISPYWINSVVPGGWSIAVEMTFYLFVPMLFRFIRSLRQALAWMVVSLLGSTAVHWYMYNHPPIADMNLWTSYLYFFFPNQVTIFFLGIILFHLIKKPEAGVAHAPPRRKDIELVLFVFAVLWAVYTITGRIVPVHVMFGTGLAIFCFILSRYAIPIFVNKFTTHIGKISFSLYLLHLAVLHPMRDLHCADFMAWPMGNFAMRFAVLLGLAVPLCTLTYEWIEKPGQQLGKRIIERIEQSYARDV